MNHLIHRRKFLQQGIAAASVLSGLGVSLGATAIKHPVADPSVYMTQPLECYAPHIGALVSMLNYNRHTVVNAVKSLTIEQLDYLHDDDANTIGSLILHLGATEAFYQANTFEGRQDFNDTEKNEWSAAMELGDRGRKEIKGHEVKYYLERIEAVRQKTLEEFKTKDDNWLLAIDPEWSKERNFNCYSKWFHVCEHAPRADHLVEKENAGSGEGEGVKNVAFCCVTDVMLVRNHE
ncbi:MAG: DUF664 domain-containing protein [Bacteroidota bacterium]